MSRLVNRSLLVVLPMTACLVAATYCAAKPQAQVKLPPPGTFKTSAPWVAGNGTLEFGANNATPITMHYKVIDGNPPMISAAGNAVVKNASGEDLIFAPLSDLVPLPDLSFTIGGKVYNVIWDLPNYEVGAHGHADLDVFGVLEAE